MGSLIVLFDLKEGVDPAEYEAWAASVDVPTVTALPSVDSFHVHRIVGTLDGSDAPYRYCEVITVNDMEQLGRDVATDAMQAVSQQFQGFADAPTFLVAERFL